MAKRPPKTPRPLEEPLRFIVAPGEGGTAVFRLASPSEASADGEVLLHIAETPTRFRTRNRFLAVLYTDSAADGPRRREILSQEFSNRGDSLLRLSSFYEALGAAVSAALPVVMPPTSPDTE